VTKNCCLKKKDLPGQKKSENFQKEMMKNWMECDAMIKRVLRQNLSTIIWWAYTWSLK